MDYFKLKMCQNMAGWGCAPDRLGELATYPPDPLIGWRGNTLVIPIPLLTLVPYSDSSFLFWKVDISAKHQPCVV